MLKALELHGFKSFADKTRFEFPDGITVVVGPNGSGKSNVVDAIRWVLGEQSAKSLRGTDMSDVIFKGSGNGQRRPANTAEVTIIFDNEDGQLDLDASEVSVTRRVYRSGEGEYLINDEPCRLRDIRDLFRGTGVGSDAYSLIEQGKVDTLLQASPKERRAIFEEAAGISRFKAKKVESQRRLDRVDQNLLRLSDIVEEVERRLKSLRNQATKARRYQEYTQRLKSLRTHVGLTDYRALDAESQAVGEKLEDLERRLGDLESGVRQGEAQLTEYESRLDSIQAETRQLEGRLTKNRERITTCETTSQLQRKTLVELEREQSQCRAKLAAVCSRAGDMRTQLDSAARELSQVEAEYAAIQARAAEGDLALRQLVEKLDQRRTAEQQQRRRHQEQIEATARLTSELNRLESELNLAQDAIDRDKIRGEQLKQQLDNAVRHAQETEAQEQALKARLDEAKTEQEQTQASMHELVRAHADLSQQLSKCQQQLTAASERSNVLEEVERRLEGIGAGTKDLLARQKAGAIGPLGEIRGMVADLIEVKVEMAPLVDAALGERAQFIVVSGQRLIRTITDGSFRLRGRVGIISLSTLSFERHRLPEQLAEEDDVIGHATDFIQVKEEWQDLAEHLLGTTWFVRSMESALHLREKHKSAPWRFVTSAGETLEADGTVFGGPRLSSGGLVSRRSELRSLQAQLKQLTQEENVLQQKLAQATAAKDENERRLLEWVEASKQASDAFATVHAKAEAARQLVQQNASNHDALQRGLSELEERQAEISSRQSRALSGLAELESLATSLEAELREHQSQLGALELDRREKEAAANTAKIELAKVEQRLETQRMRVLRAEQDNEERARTLAEIVSSLQQSSSRHRDTARAILDVTTQLATTYLEHQATQQQLQSLQSEEAQIARDRAMKRSEVKQSREQLHSLRQTQHELQIQAGELKMKRDTIAERVRDDYGIDLNNVDEDLDDAGERQEIEREIGELRRKISNIGAVNMESLAELEELEARFGSLSTQYEDLVNAKHALERIIQRINVDSRRMFVETLDIIRENFQSLFRRAFGGGQADILIEEEADILDAGIEIVATPPGKHSLNISLLSGGERALTAVTLLLAIFRHRPSPFCILDEVDGPLDEANIGRFVDVLKEFLQSTKVAIVTHSKKTMSAATTLYGVTMQESGVSKRVSVQFNDVRDDGSIRTHDKDAGRSDDGEAA